MFNVIEKHQKAVKGLMIAITATFVVWGIGGYLGMGSDDGYVAKVGSNKIYSQDIDRAIDPNSGQPQDKMQVLFGLINRQFRNFTYNWFIQIWKGCESLITALSHIASSILSFNLIVISRARSETSILI